jgi:PhzF family phenazine biosynthesis protein
MERAAVEESTLKIYQVDAFAREVFRGNPAAVLPLERWLDDATLLKIANENNLSETAFFVPSGDHFELRWFTPIGEVPLCGHATLASAYVLFEEYGFAEEAIRFSTKSGDLFVRREGDRFEMDFPRADYGAVEEIPDALRRGLGAVPTAMFETTKDPNYYAVFESEAEVRALRPDLGVVATLHPAGVVATAPGDASDCASRYFLPSFGIDEDPVTGSIHCALAPYWGERLALTEVHARQVSARGGDLYCSVTEFRVYIRGHAVKYLEGEICEPSPG